MQVGEEELTEYRSGHQERAQKFEKGGGGRNFLFPFPLKIIGEDKKKRSSSLLTSSLLPPQNQAKTKKKKIFTSSDIKFTPQNQVKTKKIGHRVLRCSLYFSWEEARTQRPPTPLGTPLGMVLFPNIENVS